MVNPKLVSVETIASAANQKNLVSVKIAADAVNPKDVNLMKLTHVKKVIANAAVLHLASPKLPVSVTTVSVAKPQITNPELPVFAEILRFPVFALVAASVSGSPVVKQKDLAFAGRTATVAMRKNALHKPPAASAVMLAKKQYVKKPTIVKMGAKRNLLVEKIANAATARLTEKIFLLAEKAATANQEKTMIRCDCLKIPSGGEEGRVEICACPSMSDEKKFESLCGVHCRCKEARDESCFCGDSCECDA